MRERLQASMIVHGAVVFVIGLLAGFPFAFVILGKIALWPLPGTADVHLSGDVRGWHMAHLEGILAFLENLFYELPDRLRINGCHMVPAHFRLAAR